MHGYDNFFYKFLRKISRHTVTCQAFHPTCATQSSVALRDLLFLGLACGGVALFQ